MIPGTAIPTSRPQVDDTLTPARASQKVSDSLSDFQPGQRLVATIQSQLANGTYRAMIAQRDVTLALPFSAKAGDQFKLEVVDTRGRVAFALAEDAPPAEGKTQQPASTTTTLSQAGRVIGTLFAKPTPGAPPGSTAEPAPTPLNRGQPLAPPPTENGAQLAPALQKAVTQSGLFFEAHLAAWLAGKHAKAALMQEPLALLPRPATADAAGRGGEAAVRGGSGGAGGPPVAAGTGHGGAPAASSTAATSSPSAAVAMTASAPQNTASRGLQAPPPAALPGAAAPAGDASTARGATAAPLFNLPTEAAPVVHQQLNALATNVYAFQAQAWIDQRVSWEIVDPEGHQGGAEEGPAKTWRSRLSLTMPALGTVEAMVYLRGDRLDIRFEVPRQDTRQTLQDARPALTARLTDLNLRLESLRIDAPAADEPADA
ncbi:MAG TPA: flagellar hook-length control protein FliK [Rhodocyclaceae bacterium]